MIDGRLEKLRLAKPIFLTLLVMLLVLTFACKDPRRDLPKPKTPTPTETAKVVIATPTPTETPITMPSTEKISEVLKAKISTAEKEKKIITDQVDILVKDKGKLSTSLSNKKTELSSYKAKFRRYMDEHRMAVVAIVNGAAGIIKTLGLESNKVLDKDAKYITSNTIVTEYDPYEMVAVINDMMKAKNEITNLETQIKEFEARISEATAQIDKHVNRMKEIDQEITSFAEQLDKLFSSGKTSESTLPRKKE